MLSGAEQVVHSRDATIIDFDATILRLREKKSWFHSYNPFIYFTVLQSYKIIRALFFVSCSSRKNVKKKIENISYVSVMPLWGLLVPFYEL